MTNLLLGYLCAVLTLIGVYCVREWRNATEYRNYIKPLLTDMQELGLITVEGKVLRDEPQEVVTRGQRQDHRGDEREADQLAHDLMVVASSEGAALR